jgi:holo-[acyl-carrier protein] synthase
MIAGLGMDICSIERIRAVIAGPRGERFLDRVYTQDERQLCGGRADAAAAYAARFAAKEALVKALGAPPGIRWRDMEVTRASGAPPGFRLSGVAKQVVEERNVGVLLAITHDAGVAAATVILESP